MFEVSAMNLFLRDDNTAMPDIMLSMCVIA